VKLPEIPAKHQRKEDLIAESGDRRVFGPGRHIDGRDAQRLRGDPELRDRAKPQ